MDNNFRVSVSAVFNKIDSSYIDRWQKQKGAIKIPIKLEGTMSQDDMKKRINEVKNSFGKISTSFDPLEPSKIQKVTLAYKDRLDTVKEVWKYNSEINSLELKSVNTTSSGVNLEKQITKEIEKQVKLTNTLMDKSRLKQAGLNSKFESGQYTPDSMVSARKLSSQLQSTMAASGNIKPENLDRYNNAVKRLHTEIGIAEKGFVRVNREQVSFGDSLKSKISSLLQYASASALLFGALQQLQQGVQYIKELNKAMTDIQLVTGMSAENIGDLTFKFSDFAKEMGATTLEVAEGSLQFYRQGKSAEDTAKLIKTSMMMSKLANIEAAQSTEYLTSIMNGFQLEAEETTEVLDKLVSIDNSSATSVAELAEAMQRSSSVAQQSGVDFNNLAAYIGTVSSVTRRSASTIGEAFKTIFVRMTEIRAGALDEDGMGINKVDDALKRVGISLRDSEGQFRDLDDVILELSTKWDRLDRMEKANISTAIAGTRQRNIFLALMDNFNQKTEDGISVQQLLEEQMDSSGLAASRYEIYLDNLEAAQNRATTAWQTMWETTIKSDWVKNFYNGSAAVMDLVTELGGLQTILLTLIPVILAFNAAKTEVAVAGMVSWVKDAWTGIRNLIPALQTATVAQSGFNLAAMTNPYVWIPLALAGLILLANAIPTPMERIQDLNSEFRKTQEEIQNVTNKAKEISELSKSFKSLKDAGSTSQEFYDVQNKLKEMMPELIGYYDAYGNFIITDTQAMEKLTDATWNQVAAQEGLEKLKKDAERSSQEGSSLLSFLYEKTKSTGGRGTGRMTESDTKKAVEEYKQALVLEKERFQLLGKEAQDAYIEGLTTVPDLQDVFIDYQKKILEAQKQAAEVAKTEQILGEKGIDSLPQLATDFSESEKGYKGLSETIKELNSQFSNLNDLMQKSIEGNLEFSDLENLPTEYIDALEIENGKISLNIDLLKEKQMQILQTSLEQVKAAYAAGTATEQEVKIIEMQIQALQQQGQAIHGAFQMSAWDNEALLWNLANSAEAAKYSFIDAEGQALTSAQSIYEMMASGNAGFNSFVEQLAIKTGNTTAEIMGMINSMIGQVSSNAAALVNYLGSTSLGVDSGFNRAPKPSVPSISQIDFAPIFPSSGSSPDFDYGGGGGERDYDNEEEERARELEDQIEKARQKAIESLNRQLKLYKDIVDERLKLLDTMADEKKYQQDVEDANKEILKIQNELSALQLDDSAEAEARRLELEEALLEANQNLEDIQYDQALEEQKAALNAEYENFQKQVEAAIQAIGDIETTSLSSFTSQLSAILSQMTNPATFHKVVENGLVGGTGLKSGEEFVKVLKGESIVNAEQMDNFMNRTLPSMISPKSFTSNLSAGVNIEKVFDLIVQGNMDSSVIPDIERISQKVVENLNKTLFSRGIIRNTNITRI